MGIGVWCWGLRLLTLVHWSVSLWIRWNLGSSCSAEWWRSSLPTFFHLNLYYTPGSVLTAPGLAESDLWTNHLNFSIFYRLRPAAFNVVLFVSAGPGPPVMNGIFKVCHRVQSLLSSEILPAAFTISFFSFPLPSCCWIGVLKVRLLHVSASGDLL